MAEEKNSPLKIAPALIGAAVSAGTSIFGAIQAGKQQRAAEAKEAEAREEMNRLQNVYANLDTSNPFLNMENTMEDLTVNQQQAQFQKQQFQQSQSNILDSLRGAAGGGGVAALAQQLSQQGQLASQQASVDIGQQEASNQMAARQEAQRIQGLQIEGEYTKRGAELDRTSTLLGMAQQQTAAAAEQAGQAQAAKMGAISGGLQNIAGAVAGFGDETAQGLGNTSIPGGTGESSTFTPSTGNPQQAYTYNPATGQYVPTE